MSLLQMRLMWPKQGEEIEVYKDGVLIAAGQVTYMDETSVSIRDASLAMYRLACQELENGIRNHSIVVKKVKQ